MVAHAVFMAQMPIYNVGKNLGIPMRVRPAPQFCLPQVSGRHGT